MKINYSKEVSSAKESGKPILALESTIIAHGMPFPHNLEFAKDAELLCRKENVVPATIAIIGGEMHVGLDTEQLIFLAENNLVKKVSRRELGLSVAEKWHGATTVSSTMHIAHNAGIPVFATGGIGGVHRGVNYSFDVSEDPTALATIPMVVISAGSKVINKGSISKSSLTSQPMLSVTSTQCGESGGQISACCVLSPVLHQ